MNTAPPAVTCYRGLLDKIKKASRARWTALKRVVFTAWNLFQPPHKSPSISIITWEQRRARHIVTFRPISKCCMDWTHQHRITVNMKESMDILIATVDIFWAMCKLISI